MSKLLRIIIPVGLLAVAALVMWYLMGMRQAPERRASKVAVKHAASMVVHPGPVQATITGYGRVASVRPIDLISEVSGELIEEKLPFQPGQPFHKGDLLIKVDDRQIKLTLNSRKADLLTALANVLPEIKVDFPGEFQKWQEYFDRCEFDQPLEPLPQAENRKVKLFLSRYNVYNLYFSARDLEIQLEKHYFYAPFDGAIVDANYRAGATARAGNNLGRIISLDELEVEIPLSVDDVRWLKSDEPVSFSSGESGEEWRGKMSRIGSAIDDRTQTIPVYVKLNGQESGALMNGVFLEADLPGQVIDPAVVVPRKAIYDNDHLYLISDGKLEYRQVEIARFELEDAIVSGGLNDGDTVVVEMLQGVVPGAPAQPRFPSNDVGSM
jgi:multidrug efflux pump subunit AcrA (membrane-fusion protein)